MNNMRDIWRRILSTQKYKFPDKVEVLSFTWDETVHRKDKSR